MDWDRLHRLDQRNHSTISLIILLAQNHMSEGQRCTTISVISIDLSQRVKRNHPVTGLKPRKKQLLLRCWKVIQCALPMRIALKKEHSKFLILSILGLWVQQWQLNVDSSTQFSKSKTNPNGSMRIGRRPAAKEQNQSIVKRLYLKMRHPLIVITLRLLSRNRIGLFRKHLQPRGIKSWSSSITFQTLN